MHFFGIPFALRTPLTMKRRRKRLGAKADYRIDFKGAITSLALLKLTRTFREMKSDQILEVCGVDAEVRSDMFRVLPAVAYEITAMDRQGDASYRIELKKR